MYGTTSHKSSRSGHKWYKSAGHFSARNRTNLEWFLMVSVCFCYSVIQHRDLLQTVVSTGTASPWWFHVFPRYFNAFWCVSRAWAQDRRARPCASDTDPSSSWIRNDGLWCCKDSQFAWAVACDRADHAHHRSCMTQEMYAEMQTISTADTTISTSCLKSHFWIQ